MSGLVLKLGPGERVLINGAVIENGDRRSRLSVKTPNVSILRLRDAIHPDEAVTPVRRACYSAQLMLTNGINHVEPPADLLKKIEELSQVFQDDDSRKLLMNATSFLLDRQYYQCLKNLRRLIPREDRLFASRKPSTT